MTEPTWYKAEYGEFRIDKSFVLFKSVDKDNNDLLFSSTAEEVYKATPILLEARALNLKEERSYSSVVGGKL